MPITIHKQSNHRSIAFVLVGLIAFAAIVAMTSPNAVVLGALVAIVLLLNLLAAVPREYLHVEQAKIHYFTGLRQTAAFVLMPMRVRAFLSFPLLPSPRFPESIVLPFGGDVRLSEAEGDLIIWSGSEQLSLGNAAHWDREQLLAALRVWAEQNGSHIAA